MNFDSIKYRNYVLCKLLIKKLGCCLDTNNNDFNKCKDIFDKYEINTECKFLSKKIIHCLSINNGNFDKCKYIYNIYKKYYSHIFV